MKRRGVLIGLLPVLLCGCASSYNVATEQQESLFMSTEREVQLGRSIARQVEKDYPPLKDPDRLARLDGLGRRIAAVADRKDLEYHFELIEQEEPNAFALPGGLVYVTTGLLKLSPTDDELASVLGHEIGHVVARHVVKRIQGQMGLQALELLAVGTRSADGRTLQGMELAMASVLTGFSQQDELEADRLGTRYLKRAGFDPLATIRFLTKLRDHTYKEPSRQFSYFRTHPYFSDRIREVRTQATGQIEFDDYINIKR